MSFLLNFKNFSKGELNALIAAATKELIRRDGKEKKEKKDHGGKKYIRKRNLRHSESDQIEEKPDVSIKESEPPEGSQKWSELPPPSDV